jgi:hypothetical protein
MSALSWIESPTTLWAWDLKQMACRSCLDMETRLGQLCVLRLLFHTEVQEHFLHNVANLLPNYSSLKQCQVFFQKL